MKKIAVDDRELTHLLGYLTPEKWADAIASKSVSKDFAKELIAVQEETYSCEVWNEVEELLEGRE